MQASFCLIVQKRFLHDLLYSWFKRMMITCVHGARACPGYPGQSAQSDGHVGGQHDARLKRSITENLCLMSSCVIQEPSSPVCPSSPSWCGTPTASTPSSGPGRVQEPWSYSGWPSVIGPITWRWSSSRSIGPARRRSRSPSSSLATSADSSLSESKFL